jgi:cysteine desulfurase
MDGMKTNRPLIYLDNAAAVPIAAESLTFMTEIAPLVTGNQEGIHCAAFHTRELLEQAAENIINTITDKTNDISLLWGDSGTTMLNTALRLPYFSTGNIITTNLEHPALTAAIQRSNAQIAIVKTPAGKIDIEHLTALLNDQTRLVAIHHVQSETGIIQDLVTISNIIKTKAPQALFLVDTVQAAGKISIPWATANLDFCFISGHKFGNPGGAAMLYRDKKLPNGMKFSAFFKKLRDQDYLLGRPEPLIQLTMAASLQRCYANMTQTLTTITKLNNQLRSELKAITLPNRKPPIFTVAPADSSPYIVHILLPEFQGAVLVRMLSEYNIAVSAGTACAAETNNPGKTLPAMGYKKDAGYSTLRISLWQHTTATMLHEFVNIFKQLLADY